MRRKIDEALSGHSTMLNPERVKVIRRYYNSRSLVAFIVGTAISLLLVADRKYLLATVIGAYTFWVLHYLYRKGTKAEMKYRHYP